MEEKKIKKCDGTMCGSCVFCSWSEWKTMSSRYWCNYHNCWVSEDDSCDDYER